MEFSQESLLPMPQIIEILRKDIINIIQTDTSLWTNQTNKFQWHTQTMDIFESFKVFVSRKLKVKQRTLNTDTNEI